MGRLADNLENAKAKVANCEYELSDVVVEQKKELCKKLYDMISTEDYKGVFGMDDSDLTIEGEYYDKYTDYYNPCCKLAIVEVCANEEECYVVDENGDEHFFVEDLTLAQVEDIVNEVDAIVNWEYNGN